MNGRSILVISALGVSAAVACSPPPAPQAPAPAPQPVAAPPAIDSSRIRDSLANAQRIADSLAARDRAAAAAIAATRATLAAKIFFEFDKSDLRDDARATLDAKVPILNANPGLRIRIEGNCDKRGSDEYNLALGQRRAAAAKRYLSEHGIDASRIEVISYGSERPAAAGDTEEAYAQNRRDEFSITAGGELLRPGQ